MNSPDYSPSPVELEIRRVRELTKARRNGEALDALEPLLSQFPENRDLLYLQAMNLRFLSRFQEALAVLEKLQQLHPRYSRLYQERGHCQVALRNAPAAIEAFLRGVNINPALPASWAMLQRLYGMTGDAKNAATAGEHVAKLRSLPPPVVEATSLFSDGDLTPAENIIRAFLVHHGDHIEAMRLLARIGLERDVLDDAELLLEAVLKIVPDYRSARFDYARTLYRRQKCAQSRAEMEKLLTLDPHNREYLKQYAASCVGPRGLRAHHRAVPPPADRHAAAQCRSRRPAPVDRARAEDPGSAAANPSRTTRPPSPIGRTSARPGGAWPT